MFSYFLLLSVCITNTLFFVLQFPYLFRRSSYRNFDRRHPQVSPFLQSLYTVLNSLICFSLFKFLSVYLIKLSVRSLKVYLQYRGDSKNSNRRHSQNVRVLGNVLECIWTVTKNISKHLLTGEQSDEPKRHLLTTEQSDEPKRFSCLSSKSLRYIFEGKTKFTYKHYLYFCPMYYV